VTLIEAIRTRDAEATRTAIASDPKGARAARAVVQAAQVAWIPGLKMLAAAGADPNGSYRNYRPLHALMQEEPHAVNCVPAKERLECLVWLLEQGADPEQLGAWPLARAIVIAGFAGAADYVKLLRTHKARMDGFAAAATGDLKGLQKALGKDPGLATARDGGVLTALHCASGCRMKGAPKVAMTELLLDAGAEVNATARSWSHEVDALYFASGSHDLALFCFLLDHGADATEGLTHALWGGGYEMAEAALARGAQPDRATANGKPLLNDLVRWGRLEQFFWLLGRGASPNVPDGNGWTAIHQAASRGNEKALRALLDAGGDPRRGDKEGQLPRDVTRSEKIAEMLKR
jgi:ankyrin repeat protein